MAHPSTIHRVSLLSLLACGLAAACSSDPGASTTGTGTTSAAGTGGNGGDGTTGGLGGNGGEATTGTGGMGTGGMGTGGMGSGTGGGTTTGGNETCTPGDIVPCYDGPPGTQGIGICTAGIQTCNDQGNGYGPCVGQVTPLQETCVTPDDDDCDGAANEDGPGCTCVPNSSTSCYSGPPATMGVGACKAGTQTCNAQGTGYGPCVGEVKPAPENCATALDEDCDGKTPACGGVGGAHLWSKLVGSGANEDPHAAAFDVFGNVLIGGHTHDQVDFGCGPIKAVDPYPGLGEPLWLAKLTSAGACLWTKKFGESGGVYGAASDASGNVYLAGDFAGTVNFGGGALTSAGDKDIFVARLDPNGNHLWSKRFGDAAKQGVGALAVDASGNVIVIGSYQGSVNFGGGDLPSAGGADAYVVKLSADGAHVFSKRFGDAADQKTIGAAVDAAGNVYITGVMSGSADFGGGVLTSAGGTDAFLARFAPGGDHLWSKRYGDAENQLGAAVAVDPTGNLLVVGDVDGTIDFGGGVAISSVQQTDVWVLKLTAAGAPVWAKAGAGQNIQRIFAVGSDAAGNVTVGGGFLGTIDFGGGAMTSAGVTDGFLARFDSNGKHLWSKRFGDASAQNVKVMGVDPTGKTFIGCSIYGNIDFGDGVLHPGLGGEDTGVAMYGP